MPDNLHPDYEFKPKRKRQPARTYILLGAGVLLGIFVTAIIGVSALLFIGSSETISVYEPDMNASTTSVPFDAQAQSVDIQPTVISERIQAAEISPDNTHLAIANGDYNGGLRLVELRVERNLTGEQFTLSDERFDFLTFSADSRWLLAINNGNGLAYLYDVQQRRIVEQYMNVVGGGFTAGGDVLALVQREELIRVLDVSGSLPAYQRDVATFSRTASVSAVAISSNQRVALASSTDNQVRVIDLTTEGDAPLIVQGGAGYPHDMAFTPDGTHLAMTFVDASAQSSQVIIYEFENGSRQIFDYDVPIYSLAFSQDSEWLVVGGGESGIGDAHMSAFRWNVDNAPIQPNAAYYQPLTFEGHSHTIYDVVFTPENYILSASWDGSVRLWDRDTPNAAISVLLP